MKTYVFLPGQLLIGDGAYYTIAPNDSATEVSSGKRFFQVLQKANAKRRLARHVRAAQHKTISMLEL